jgi:hypothetical protein
MICRKCIVYYAMKFVCAILREDTEEEEGKKRERMYEIYAKIGNGGMRRWKK